MKRRYKITSCTLAVPCPDIISELKAIAIVEGIEFPLSRLEDLFNSVPVILSDLTPLETLFRQWSKEHLGIAVWMTVLDYDAMTDTRLKFTAGTIIYREQPLGIPTRQDILSNVSPGYYCIIPLPTNRTYCTKVSRGLVITQAGVYSLNASSVEILSPDTRTLQQLQLEDGEWTILGRGKIESTSAFVTPFLPMEALGTPVILSSSDLLELKPLLQNARYPLLVQVLGNSHICTNIQYALNKFLRRIPESVAVCFSIPAPYSLCVVVTKAGIRYTHSDLRLSSHVYLGTVEPMVLKNPGEEHLVYSPGGHSLDTTRPVLTVDTFNLTNNMEYLFVMDTTLLQLVYYRLSTISPADFETLDSMKLKQEQVAVKLAEINSQMEDLERKKMELLESIRCENSALLPPVNPDYHE